MKTKILAVFLLVLTFAACKKESDWADDWAGTYTGLAGSVNVNRVIISKVGAKAVKMDLQGYTSGTYFTFATIGSGTLTSATHASIDEDGTILMYPGKVFHFSGSVDRNGSNITMIGQAVNKNDASEIYYYSFNGGK
ncbi:MAG: hypothetical protein U0V74_14325 [Chitinophagales bacterium]